MCMLKLTNVDSSRNKFIENFQFEKKDSKKTNQEIYMK